MSGKYSKFDSFLKRTLNNKEYKEVKIYEPCVVNSSREKHAFRFTFLTRDQIFITENPPKSLLYSVHLKQVVDVSLLNDRANFLQAELRDTVQHVVVKYTTDSPTGSRSLNTLTKADSTYSSSSILSSSNRQSEARSSGPVLCVYSNVVAIDDNHSTQQQESVHKDVQEKHVNKWNLLKSVVKFKTTPRRSGRWIPKDPYPIHVLDREPGEGDGSSIQTIEELHLYILNDHTTFLLMLQSIWRNYIFYHSFSNQEERFLPERDSTIHFDDVNLSKNQKQVSSHIDENTRKLFSDLKRELQFAQSVEQMYRLYSELKTSVSHDILIKFLFWKDDILLKLSTNLASKCIKQSNSSDINERADEIELAILILQTITVMLKETEAIPQCYRVLQNISTPYLQEMVDLLLCSPNSSTWDHDIDLMTLSSECTVASAEVIYELIITSQQICWTVSGKSPVFCTDILFQLVNQSKHLCPFLDRLMLACVEIWNPQCNAQSSKTSTYSSQTLSGPESFSPESAIQVFSSFTVFHRFMVNCSVAARHLKDSFKEEFKYYIHPNSVSGKFPKQYPISSMARSVVHAVGFYVTSGS